MVISVQGRVHTRERLVVAAFENLEEGIKGVGGAPVELGSSPTAVGDCEPRSSQPNRAGPPWGDADQAVTNGEELAYVTNVDGVMRWVAAPGTEASS